MNAGFRSAEGEYLVALNNDTVADAEWLKALIRENSSGKWAAIIAFACAASSLAFAYLIYSTL